MTLLIACLIIYGLHMEPWLYAVAILVWGVHVWALSHMASSAHDLSHQIAKLWP
jgi:hypothetical protein